MSAQAVREYLILIWQQYQEASKNLKSQLLDEIVKNTGIHRGSAKRLMSRRQEPEFKRGKGQSVNSYRDMSKKLLIELWKDMGHLEAVRMKGAIAAWIDKWQHPELDDYLRFELLKMSASTIERALQEEKAKLRLRLNTGAKSSGHKHKTSIPVRDLGQRPQVPGHREIDCVAYYGGSLSGEHIWTLTLTDIVTGHTENEALQYKNGWEVKLALERIEARLPFPLIALYVDNGSEFLNDDVCKRFSLKKTKLPVKRQSSFFGVAPTRKTTAILTKHYL